MFRETGAPDLVLEMEGHGREHVRSGIDLSRTVGWFTSIFPVRFSMDPSVGTGEQLRAIGEQLRQVPRRGFDYGVLRYLIPDLTVRQTLGSQPAPWLNFNYLGQFDHLASAPDLPVRLAPEAPGPEQHPQSNRGALLNVVAIVTGGRLGIRWIYSRNLHNRATISRLSRTYMSELQELAEVCNSH
jgi:non-ribosomal peptide synthase protein (TIGR01720 family)